MIRPTQGNTSSLPGGDAAGVDVGLQVIHGQQRLVDRHAEGLGRHEPDQQRAGQSRRIGHGHGVDVGQRQVGPLERLVDYRQDAFEVCPRGDFRHDAAEPAGAGRLARPPPMP